MPERGRVGFLLDTHVWLWYLWKDGRLPLSLRSLIDNDLDRMWLSPISVWELGTLAETKRVRLDEGLDTWVDAAFAQLPLKDAVLTHHVAVVSHEHDLPTRDPADRMLAATALVYDLTLVTLDRALTGARWLPTRSR